MKDQLRKIERIEKFESAKKDTDSNKKLDEYEKWIAFFSSQILHDQVRSNRWSESR